MFKDFIHLFLDYYRSVKRVSKHTLIAYENDLWQFDEYCQTTYELEDPMKVSYLIVRSYIMELSEKGVSNSSINRKISCLRSFYNLLKKEHKLKHNPTAKIQALKIPKRLPKFIKEEEASYMLEDDLKEEGGYEAIRDHLIIELLYSAGLRRSELIELKLSSIDNSNKSITVLGKGNKERSIPLTNHLLEKISAYKQIRAELSNIENPENLFLLQSGKKLYPQKVYRIVKSYLIKYSRSNKKSPHVLRHSFATHLSNEGAEIQAVKELLGHASLAATQIYTHNTIDKLKKVYRQAHPKS